MIFSPDRDGSKAATRRQTIVWKQVGPAAMVAAMAFPAGMGLSAGEEGVQAASGMVVAVTEASKTIVVESTLGGKPWIIGAEVTDQTRFGGKAKGYRT